MMQHDGRGGGSRRRRSGRKPAPGSGHGVQAGGQQGAFGAFGGQQVRHGAATHALLGRSTHRVTTPGALCFARPCAPAPPKRSYRERPSPGGPRAHCACARRDETPVGTRVAWVRGDARSAAGSHAVARFCGLPPSPVGHPRAPTGRPSALVIAAAPKTAHSRAALLLARARGVYGRQGDALCAQRAPRAGGETRQRFWPFVRSFARDAPRVGTPAQRLRAGGHLRRYWQFPGLIPLHRPICCTPLCALADVAALFLAAARGCACARAWQGRRRVRRLPGHSQRGRARRWATELRPRARSGPGPRAWRAWGRERQGAGRDLFGGDRRQERRPHGAGVRALRGRGAALHGCKGRLRQGVAHR